MKLIIGLGNPAKQYDKTRHNIGFAVIDAFAKNNIDGKISWQKEKKALTCPLKYTREKIILVKPETFMNNSGDAVSLLKSFYKVKAEDIWVVHDDLDLELGQIKISFAASSAGHNGVQSIIDKIKTKQFIRFRLGIMGKKPAQQESADYVLQKFNKQENATVKKMISQTVEAIETSLAEGTAKAMNQYN